MRLTLLIAPFCLLTVAGCGPKHFTATTTLQLYRDDSAKIVSKEIEEAEKREQIESAVNVIESAHLLMQVEKMLIKSDTIEAFSLPYLTKSNAEFIPRILNEHRTVEVREHSRIICISYAHPNPDVAEFVCDAFAKALIDHNIKLNIDEEMRKVEDLLNRAEQQKERVEDLEIQLAALREQRNILAPDTYETHLNGLLRDMEVQQTFFKALNDRMTQTKCCQFSLHSEIRIVETAVVK